MLKLPLFRIVVLSLLLLVVGFAGFKILSSQKEEVKKKMPPPLSMVAVAKVVHYSALTPVLEASGRIQSLESMDLVPEVSAKALEVAFRLREGMQFSAGDTLLILDDAVARNSFRSASADLVNAIAGILPDLRADWSNQAGAWEKFLSELNLDHLPALPAVEGNLQVFLARNKVFTLYYNASNLQIQLQKHVILAPFRGAVLKTMVTPGSFVRSGVTVAQLTRTEGLELSIPLPLDEVRHLRPGHAVVVYLENGKDSIRTQVGRIMPLVDAQTQTQQVFLRVQSDARKGVLAGAYASVRMRTEALPRAFALPRAAMPVEGMVHLVRGGLLQNVNVNIARRDAESLYITSGIEEGDTVLVQAVAEAVPGTPVQVQVAP